MNGFVLSLAVLFLVSPTLGRCSTAAESPAKAEDLLAIIAKEQVAVTGYSTGFEAYNCYTEAERDRWQAARGWTRVVDRVKTNPRFRTVVSQIAAMDPASREKLLTKAARSRRPTYAEAIPLGPDNDGHSTTDAGAYVESLIARTIVDLVRSTLRDEEKQEKRNVR